MAYVPPPPQQDMATTDQAFCQQVFRNAKIGTSPPSSVELKYCEQYYTEDGIGLAVVFIVFATVLILALWSAKR